jgi:hypothetical protein
VRVLVDDLAQGRDIDAGRVEPALPDLAEQEVDGLTGPGYPPVPDRERLDRVGNPAAGESR